MDCSSPGDMYKIFNIFKQKCKLIFDGPLDKGEEVKKVTLLLLWIGDKGNILTFKQVCDLSKVEENTKVQMEIISKDEDISDLHTVQRMHEQESPHSSQKFQKQGFKQRTFSNDQN